MAYLVQKTRVSSVTINGIDYTDSFISFQVADSTANRQGFVSTTGEIVLGQRAGVVDIEDYDRDNFKRGALVILDIQEPGGASYRHPRGYLYVLGTSYNISEEALTVSVGCRIALATLVDDPSAFLGLVPIPLDPAQKELANCSSSFSAAAKYLYQDNTGALVENPFWGTDSYGFSEAGEFVSVLGETTLSVSPLQGGGAIPDRIKLQYAIPRDAVATDETGRIDTVTTTNYYFLQYPATIYTRKPLDESPTGNPIGDIEAAGGSLQNPFPVSPDPCGNTPPPPTDGPEGAPTLSSCNDNYQTSSAPFYVSVTSQDIDVTTYGAPGGQVSYRKVERYGPALEANSSYYADVYAYCKQVYASRCNPNGSCGLDGLAYVLLGYVESWNYYGEANELIETVSDTYETTLSAAISSNWRAGVEDGVVQSFRYLSNTSLYRSQRVIDKYYKDGNANVQETLTYNSIASRGTGILNTGSLDALGGILTRTVRRSTSTATLDVRPDTVNTATTDTVNRTSLISLRKNEYTLSPSEAGPYEVEASIPVPLLFNTEAEINDVVNDYSFYLQRFTLGEAYGLQIGEALRSEIVTNWRPGMPFRYVDPTNDKIIAMRMDACTWGVTKNESIVVFNGMYIGASDGTLTIGNNLVGDSRPDVGSGTTPPAGQDPPPSITGETYVNSGNFYFEVDVELALDVTMSPTGNDGVLPKNPTDLSAQVEMTFVAFVSGAIVGPGDLLDSDGTGGIPLEYNGSLIVVNATVIDDDLFSA